MPPFMFTLYTADFKNKEEFDRMSGTALKKESEDM